MSTVLVLGGILAPALPGNTTGIGDRYLAAFGIAILISVAEFVAAGRWPAAYWLAILLFAESRVAKIIPGRVEDRLTQVRDIRHTEKPAPPGRVLRMRDNGGERVIPFVEGRKFKG